MTKTEQKEANRMLAKLGNKKVYAWTKTTRINRIDTVYVSADSEAEAYAKYEHNFITEGMLATNEFDIDMIKAQPMMHVDYEWYDSDDFIPSFSEEKYDDKNRYHKKLIENEEVA